MANIDPRFAHNFDKHIHDATDVGPYDYNSIMHYPATAFSVNGKETIRTKNGNRSVSATASVPATSRR